jgi:hypothetical protein
VNDLKQARVSGIRRQNSGESLTPVTRSPAAAAATADLFLGLATIMKQLCSGLHTQREQQPIFC